MILPQPEETGHGEESSEEEDEEEDEEEKGLEALEEHADGLTSSGRRLSKRVTGGWPGISSAVLSLQGVGAPSSFLCKGPPTSEALRFSHNTHFLGATAARLPAA